jgi:biopolymer transport protein ExbD
LAPRRALALLVSLTLAGTLAGCPAPRSLAGVVYSSVAGGSARAMTKPLQGATVTWSCPPGVQGGPPSQTLTTEYNGMFAAKSFYTNLPNDCELVVTKPGHLEFREKFAKLCAEPTSDSGCRRVNVAVELRSVEEAAATAVPLDVPKAGNGDMQTVFSIVLAADGTTQVDGKPVPNDDAVLDLAKVAREKNPELRAVIKADASVPHGRVIHVLDLLKMAMVSKIAFGVSPVAPNADRP